MRDEIGHALGMHHSGDVSSVMHPSLAAGDIDPIVEPSRLYYPTYPYPYTYITGLCRVRTRQNEKTSFATRTVRLTSAHDLASASV
ncbi:MAG: hypothetical protein KDB23_22795 [Planctomycetales bacterium]|nr:hypothetical protein [Planctomycetales bacterium]